MARLSAPAWSSLTRNVAFDDQGIRPSTSIFPFSRSSRSSRLPGSGWIMRARCLALGVVVAGMAVQPGADVARRVERAAAQRAGRAAALHGGAAPAGHGPGLGGGEVEAGQVALLLVVVRDVGLAELVVVLVAVVLLVLVVGQRPLVELEHDQTPPGIEADADGHRPEQRDGVPPQHAGLGAEIAGGLAGGAGVLRLDLFEQQPDPFGQHGHLLLLDEDRQHGAVLLGLDVEGPLPRLADRPGGDGVDGVELDLRHGPAPRPGPAPRRGRWWRRRRCRPRPTRGRAGAARRASWCR